MVIVYIRNGDTAAFSAATEDAARRYPGERVGGRNAQFYGGTCAAPVRDATAVYVSNAWPQIIADYRAMGLPVHVLEELGRQAAAPVEIAGPPAPARARGRVEKPQQWRSNS